MGELDWRRSSACGNGAGVEIARGGGGHMLMRDGEHRHGAVLRFTDAEWQAFVSGGRAGEFDLV